VARVHVHESGRDRMCLVEIATTREDVARASRAATGNATPKPPRHSGGLRSESAAEVPRGRLGGSRESVSARALRGARRSAQLRNAQPHDGAEHDVELPALRAVADGVAEELPLAAGLPWIHQRGAATRHHGPVALPRRAVARRAFVARMPRVRAQLGAQPESGEAEGVGALQPGALHGLEPGLDLDLARVQLRCLPTPCTSMTRE